MESDRTGWLRAAAAALLGGTWGGALVGLAEALSIALTAGPGEDYWLFPYAVVAYGLCGACLGLALWGLTTPVAAWRRRLRRGAFGAATAAAVFVLGGAVARYNVVQRVYHEELVTLSPQGVMVHLVLAAGLGACAAAALWLGERVWRRAHGAPLAAAALAGCLALSAGVASLASPRPSTAAPIRGTGTAVHGPPNIILIIADTLRADALGCYTGRAGVTPGLDGFAARAVRFSNAYSQATWTRPSIATILTSLYPSEHGAIHKLDALPDRVTTLAEALRAAGYWTAGFVSNINVAPVFNFQQGFEEYHYLEPSFYFWATDSATRLAVYKGLRVMRERFFRDRIYYYNYYQDASVVEGAAAGWLEHRPPHPFFLFIHFMDPHDPYFEHPYDGKGVARVMNPDPAPSRKDELHTLYGEDVSYLDRYLGRLFDRLQALGLYDDTVVALTADHGEEFQEHGGWWHGTTMYQEEMHVPLLIKRAREPRPGTVVPDVVRSLDIAPTLMAAAGLVPAPSFMGRDLFAVPAGPPVPLYAEEDLEGNVLAALRVGAWKLITANPGNPRGLHPVELYNLDDDPAERHDLSARQPQRVREMLQLLTEQQERIRGPGALGGDFAHVADHRS